MGRPTNGPGPGRKGFTPYTKGVQGKYRRRQREPTTEREAVKSVQIHQIVLIGNNANQVEGEHPGTYTEANKRTAEQEKQEKERETRRRKKCNNSIQWKRKKVCSISNGDRECSSSQSLFLVKVMKGRVEANKKIDNKGEETCLNLNPLKIVRLEEGWENVFNAEEIEESEEGLPKFSNCLGLSVKGFEEELVGQMRSMGGDEKEAIGENTNQKRPKLTTKFQRELKK